MLCNIRMAASLHAVAAGRLLDPDENDDENGDEMIMTAVTYLTGVFPSVQSPGKTPVTYMTAIMIISSSFPSSSPCMDSSQLCPTEPHLQAACILGHLQTQHLAHAGFGKAGSYLREGAAPVV